MWFKYSCFVKPEEWHNKKQKRFFKNRYHSGFFTFYASIRFAFALNTMRTMIQNGKMNGVTVCIVINHYWLHLRLCCAVLVCLLVSSCVLIVVCNEWSYALQFAKIGILTQNVFHLIDMVLKVLLRVWLAADGISVNWSTVTKCVLRFRIMSI